LPQRVTNGADAFSYGFEVASTWRVTDRFRLSGWYSFFELQVHPDPSSGSGTGAEGEAPKHQARVVSTLDLPRNLSLETALHFVDRLPGEDVPKYLRLDLRLVWRLRKDLDLSVGGQNLLDRTHLENGTAFAAIQSNLVERAYEARLKWRF